MFSINICHPGPSPFTQYKRVKECWIKVDKQISATQCSYLIVYGGKRAQGSLYCLQVPRVIEWVQNLLLVLTWSQPPKSPWLWSWLGPDFSSGGLDYNPAVRLLFSFWCRFTSMVCGHWTLKNTCTLVSILQETTCNIQPSWSGTKATILRRGQGLLSS